MSAAHRNVITRVRMSLEAQGYGGLLYRVTAPAGAFCRLVTRPGYALILYDSEKVT